MKELVSVQHKNWNLRLLRDLLAAATAVTADTAAVH